MERRWPTLLLPAPSKSAALDVTEVEPIPSDDRLLQLSNCIVTPHVAGFLADVS